MNALPDNLRGMSDLMGRLTTRAARPTLHAVARAVPTLDIELDHYAAVFETIAQVMLPDYPEIHRLLLVDAQRAKDAAERVRAQR